MDIGQRIIQLREAQGWSTNRLAYNCGLSQSFLRSVELGEKGISVESLSLLCDALRISLRDFFDDPAERSELPDRLSCQIARMTAEQQKALSSFLNTIVN